MLLIFQKHGMFFPHDWNCMLQKPSWADEFIFAVRENITSNISYIHTDNPSVTASLQAITD